MRRGGIGWDCLYLFLCLCYSCGLPESGDRDHLKTPPVSFKFTFTSPLLFGIVSSCEVVALHVVKTLASAVRRWKVKSEYCEELLPYKGKCK